MPFMKPQDLVFDANSGTVGPGLVYAKNTIHIKEGAVIAPGTDLVAGRALKVDPKFKLVPNVRLRIGYPLTSCNLPPTANRITDFSNICNDINKYDPEVPPSGPVFFDDDKEDEPIPERSFTLYGIMPNPASHSAQLVVDCGSIVDLDIEIMSMQGVLMSQEYGIQLPIGRSNVPIDISTLPIGVYVVQVTSTTGDVYTEKLIVH